MSNDNAVWIHQNEQGETVVGLDVNPGIAEAKAIYEALKGVVRDKSDCVIDTSRIERIDTAVLQLLIAFVRELRNLGAEIRWENPSPVLRKAVTLLDLEECLDLPAAS